jgi:hypothetical protein
MLTTKAPRKINCVKHIERARLIQCVSLFFMGLNPTIGHFYAKLAPKVSFLAKILGAFYFLLKFMMTKGDDSFWRLHERHER